MTTIVVTDETGLDELSECLVNLNHHAKRQARIVGSGETPWDKAHRRIDSVLGDWLEAARVAPEVIPSP